jgi:hypothetical protein
MCYPCSVRIAGFLLYLVVPSSTFDFYSCGPHPLSLFEHKKFLKTSVFEMYRTPVIMRFDELKLYVISQGSGVKVRNRIK